MPVLLLERLQPGRAVVPAARRAGKGAMPWLCLRAGGNGLMCETCQHRDASGLVPICRKSGPPNACVLAYARAIDAQARRGRYSDKCPHWVKA